MSIKSQLSVNHLTIIVITSIVITVDDLTLQNNKAKVANELAEEAFLNLQKTADYLMRKVAEALKPYEITPPQYNVLRILRGAGEAGLINREIGERMLTFVPDVTRMLDRLEARKLICRERGVEDRRLVTACITPEGLKLLADLDEIFRDFHQNLLGGCHEEELKTLVSMLEKLRLENFNDSAKLEC